MAALTYPNIDPVAFAIGATEVRWYGLAYMFGLIIGVWILWRLNKRWDVGLDANQTADILLAAIVAIMLGGRLGYVLFYNLDYYLANPGKIVALWDGGMAFHGALAGMIVAGWLMSRRLGIPFLRLLDMGAIGTPIGIFLGRLANFANGELWGRTTEVAWGMVFPGAGELPRHPSQLYEAFGEGLLIFAVLWALSRRKRPDGTYIGLFILIYGTVRFVVEFVREPDVQLGLVLGPFSMGQLLTLPMIAAGAWLVWWARRRPAASTEVD